MKTRFDSQWLALHVACACLALPVSVTAASFDCSKVSTPIETTICQVPALSGLDDRLNAAYSNALAHDPSQKKVQREWLATVRDHCEDQACLTAAYTQRIEDLEQTFGQGQAATAEPAAKAQTGEKRPTTDPLAAAIDVTYFYGLSDRYLRSLWSDKNGVLFDKKIIDWTDTDFALLEQKLKEQITVEWDAAVARHDKIVKMGYQANPAEEDRDYSFRKGIIDNVITSIPSYKDQVGETRKKFGQELAEAEAQAEKQQALQAKQEDQRAADAQHPNQQQAEAETQASGSNRSWIVFAVIAAILGGWIWNKFIRLRCARCKSTNIDTLSVNEVDRWRGTKQVTERNTRGTKTRHVSTTYVKNEYHYECRDCGEDWLLRKKEEL